MKQEMPARVGIYFEPLILDKPPQNLNQIQFGE
jgi:hypothetical protein